MMFIDTIAAPYPRFSGGTAAVTGTNLERTAMRLFISYQTLSSTPPILEPLLSDPLPSHV